MNKEVVRDLKTKYSHIYSVSDNEGAEYLFRSLDLKEVGLVEDFITQELISSFELENFCLEACLLYPENVDLDDIPPGVAKQIADEILRVSGIADADYIMQAMHHVRAESVGDILLDIKSYIISAIPTYTDKELDKFTLLELIEKLILSEKILTLQARLAGIDHEVQLAFEYLDSEDYEVEEGPQPQPKARKKSETELPDKEELIRRIQSENRNKYSSRDTYVNQDAAEEWQGFDADLLAKMEGEIDPEDPIARKLLGL